MFKPTQVSVLFSGICALILSLGIARYSLTPMIPGMQEQMGVTEGLAGWLAGWNYIGYLTGLFIVWLISDLRTKDFFYRYGLIVAVLATAVMATHEVRIVWYVSRFFTGVASAMGFMLGTGLVLNWLHHHNYKGELGIHFSGIGLGIICSAIVVDITNLDSLFSLNWRLQWVALAGIGLLLLIPAIALLPMPKEKEEEMAEDDDVIISNEQPSMKWLWLMQGAYFCAGFSNTVNVTFTSLITELQPLDGLGAKMWLLVGLAATPAPFIWDRIARRFGSMDALRAAFILNIVGNICLATTSSLATTAIASLLFGFTFMGIVSQTLSTVGRMYGAQATQIMARLTLGYCVAQILSPIISGTVAEATGSFTLPLYVVSSIMIVGIVCLMLLRNESKILIPKP
ncbi:MAG: YbfB/YjiJ family MFS transporter [Spongiibacteraceae bacterium]|nr:YbfB/YjiJ family MFS transporter [Spongiibacteraceae bacterium]